jgi:hypothetical protein
LDHVFHAFSMPDRFDHLNRNDRRDLLKGFAVTFVPGLVVVAILIYAAVSLGLVDPPGEIPRARQSVAGNLPR